MHFLLLLSLVALPQKGQDEIVAFVAEVQGSWELVRSLEPPKPIDWGMALPGDSLIRARTSSDSGGRVRIACLDGTTQSCDLKNGCREIRMPAPSTVVVPTLGERIRSALARFLSEPPERYVSALSRSTRSRLRESVVELRADNIDLRTLLTSSGDDEMLVLLQRRTRSAPSVEWGDTREAKISFASLISGQGFQEGLYRVVEVDENREPTGDECWVLLVEESRYEKLSQDFRSLESLVRQWAADLGENTLLRGVLRAGLEVLSELPDTYCSGCQHDAGRL
jgi:hypothetical protein